MYLRTCGTIRSKNDAVILHRGAFVFSVLLLTCVLMAGVVSADVSNYYKVPEGTTWSGYNITSDFRDSNNNRVNFTDLISAITYARSHVSADEPAVFYCKPGAEIYGAISPTYAANHPPVNFSFTIYGNGAFVAHSINSPTAEFDFSIDNDTELLWNNTKIKISDLKEGQNVSITSTGEVLESYPAQLTEVTKIIVLEDEL